jgi:2,3-bisphosphoglycerate-dependent phosphoglycerate mutase
LSSVPGQRNSRRALVKPLDDILGGTIVGLNIPTGILLVYELTGDQHPIRLFHPGDGRAVGAATTAVASQLEGTTT